MHSQPLLELAVYSQSTAIISSSTLLMKPPSWASSQMEMRQPTEMMSECCQSASNLCLNISKTKVMIVDYRMLLEDGRAPLYISGAAVES